jgi:hypothetical protein
LHITSIGDDPTSGWIHRFVSEFPVFFDWINQWFTSTRNMLMGMDPKNSDAFHIGRHLAIRND